MVEVINAKQLRTSLPRVVAQVRRDARYVVIYRSRPAFQIIPIEADLAAPGRLEDDPLYGAGPVGRSADGQTAASHDDVLYGR